MTAPELLAELAPTDPLAGARLRGMEVKRGLLYSDGQPLRSEEVAQLLGISRQAVGNLLTSNPKLLAEILDYYDYGLL